jgi:hypothetical protein
MKAYVLSVISIGNYYFYSSYSGFAFDFRQNLFMKVWKFIP